MVTTVQEVKARSAAVQAEEEKRPQRKGLVGPKGTQRRRMTESDAVLLAAQARRLVKPVLVTGVQEATTITVIPHSQFGRLNVDERYQRLRIGGEVNQLINVLKSGGSIPDPIDVSERPDGSWWIVDGQQRFWAHDECQMPLKAHIHKCETLEAEARLFMALNSRRRVLPRTLIKGWPGPSGEFVRRMNDSDNSPVRGMIDFKSNSKLPLDAPTVLKGVLTTLTGVVPNGDMATVILPRTDAALRGTGMVTWAEAFVQLLALVFGMTHGAGRVRILPVVALAHVAHRKFKEHGRPTFPKSCALLRRVNWDTLVPSHAQQYLPILEHEIEKRWK